jgi:hypothetical protein
VKGFSAEPINRGYTAAVCRLVLEYEDDSGAAPRSLVMKVHGSAESTRALFESLGIYEKEVRFYQTLARDRELPVPVCYAAEYNPHSGDFVLLMEDLAMARVGSDGEDLVGDIRIALSHMAQIHPSFWGDRQLLEYDWIVNSTDPVNPPPHKELWARNLTTVKRLFPGGYSGYTRSVCDKWLDNWNATMRCLSRDTHTLLHTDVHLGQMFFPTAELPRFALFDW